MNITEATELKHSLGCVNAGTGLNWECTCPRPMRALLMRDCLTYISRCAFSFAQAAEYCAGVHARHDKTYGTMERDLATLMNSVDEIRTRLVKLQSDVMREQNLEIEDAVPS